MIQGNGFYTYLDTIEAFIVNKHSIVEKGKSNSSGRSSSDDDQKTIKSKEN